MSNIAISRHASAKIVFNGVDVTDEIKESMISIQYTDCEEDNADDLQLKLEDREDVWMGKWLGAVIEKDTSGEDETSQTYTYTCTARTGLNVRTGPSTSYGKAGKGWACGDEVEVISISGNWAKVLYNGEVCYSHTNWLKAVDEEAPNTSTQSQTGSKGMTISGSITASNWDGKGGDKKLDIGWKWSTQRSD